MHKRIAILLLSALFAANLTMQDAQAKETTIMVQPKGDYATIDTKATNEIIDRLLHKTKQDRDEAAAEVLKSPDRFAPPALYSLSHVLFEDGKKDEAAFWFYAGQLRSRCDGQLCTDASARQGTAVMNYQFGPEINDYMRQRLTQMKELIPKVVEWDRKTPHNYDRRWMALHGMGSFLAQDGKSAPITIPKEDWDKSDEKLRAEYLNLFSQAIDKMIKEKNEQSKKQP